MKFLIDAQLPRRLAAQFRQAGLEAIHTLDLPAGNRTTDRVINELSIKEQYIVVTKDSDFVESKVCRGDRLAFQVCAGLMAMLQGKRRDFSVVWRRESNQLRFKK